MSILASVALAAAAGPSPCLLVGPSQSVVVVAIAQNSDGEVVVAPYAGREWPFGDQFNLTATSGRYRQAQPRSDGLVVEFTPIDQTYNVEIYRGGGGRHKGLPVFSGSCPSQSNPGLSKYATAVAARRGATPSHDAIIDGRLSDSKDCQVASSAGWVSRFSFLAGDWNGPFPIDPRDDYLWPKKLSVEKHPGLPLPPPTSVFGMLSFDGVGSPRSFNGAMWFSSSNDGQSISARVEFYDYTGKGSPSKEWLSGICSDFVSSGAAVS
ncbi:hypothetical protein EEB18_018270 [Sphingopyxis sp. OPL5]|uniref:hypothetical protein n=1 Tax=Sphingopyxis sp. OPL5 TaxID=2486273 RepID=UPI00164DAA40|nr:hypothetical protein [Sphingopyxis sp. OPL5]QNO26655.1 hypothetical protein EEB18_018270 [Sphingopyxis sp. OPL5]